jgi:hypothetical protein
LHIVDLSLSGILDHLTTRAYSKPCSAPEGNFLLAPSAIAFGTSPQGLSQTLNRIYQHARDWAPGLDIPWFVPPVRIANLESEAGHFLLDEESYASIAVSTEYLGSAEATCLILAHEACHHILLQSGVCFQFKNDLLHNERVTDLAMFVCGFGEIVRCGHSLVRSGHGQYVKTHLGYLESFEIDAAYRYVLTKRKERRLPVAPPRPSVLAYLREQIGRLTKQSSANKGNSSLLAKVIEESERRNRRRR